MNWIVLPRGAGKTHEALKWLLADAPDEYRIMLTCSEPEANRLRSLARDMGFPNSRVVSVSNRAMWQLLGRVEGLKVVYGIDNLELVLPMLLGGPVGLATYTGKAPLPEDVHGDSVPRNFGASDWEMGLE